jgi:hypothetical protein
MPQLDARGLLVWLIVQLEMTGFIGRGIVFFAVSSKACIGHITRIISLPIYANADG